MRLLRYLLRSRYGGAAVEFAIIAPLYIMIILTLLAYGIYFTAAYSVQQIAADAARTAVAGLSATERTQLAEDFVRKSTLNYAFLDSASLDVTVKDDPNNANQFMVSIEYDASGLPIWNLLTFSLPQKNINRFATIRLGGI